MQSLIWINKKMDLIQAMINNINFFIYNFTSTTTKINTQQLQTGEL